MEFTTDQKKELLNILTLHSGLFGNEREKCQELIDIIEENHNTTPVDDRIEAVIQRVSDTTLVPIDRIKSRSRKREVVMARSYAIYVIMKEIYPIAPGLTLEHIGSFFYKMDHATVSQARSRIERWLDNGDEITLTIHNLYNGSKTIAA